MSADRLSPAGGDGAGMNDFGMGYAGLRCHVRSAAPIGLIEVAGVLRLSTVPRLREAVLKVISEDPEAIVLDLGELEAIENGLSLVAFSTLGQLVSDHNAGELVLAVPSIRVRVALQRQSSLFVRVFATRAQALLAARMGVAPRVVRRELPAVPQAPRLARCLVQDVCARWQLGDELREQAQIVVTELVSNAVEHAGGGIELAITVGRCVLRLEVADDNSDVLPNPLDPPTGARQGHGLRLVAKLASHCGGMATSRGKTMWADLVLCSRWRMAIPGSAPLDE